ncbi:MAG: hypothetical protein DRG66_07960 [Deltaproteobacteria bacterium]|jgi:hypothetical protein|nr:MAG: hypothetical protein DRG66_07960 [Deltaproteobacteria bacterium]
MSIDRKVIKNMFISLPSRAKTRLKRATELIVKAKKKGGKVVAVVGSGPNLHEGVTTLLAELMHKGIIDGVSTSSAVINHEMAGTLEKVKRFDGVSFGFEREKLPSDSFFEVSILSKARLEEFQREMPIDMDLYQRMRRAKGDVIIKVAGNMAYPTGLRAERLARDVLAMAKRCGIPFEQMAGYGADRLTMIGAGAEHNIPVLVTVPQLVGGGEVGLAIGDSLSISERCYRIARLLDSADVIIESALALSQEVHDGPFEGFTGHGIWADWEGGWTYSLADKKIVRIDLDPNLERAWMQERKSKMVTEAVHKGLPKTKLMQIPFRMEMSGFARIPGSLPIVGDIGEIWPLLATMVADALDVRLDFMSYKQSLPAGEKIREWIVKYVQPVNKERIFEAAKELTPDNRR